MTKLAEVLAEEWSNDVTHVDAGDAAEGSTAQFGHYEERNGESVFEPGGHGSRDAVRAAVCVLGKSALALVLKHDEDMLRRQCLACGSISGTHRDDCTWGRIVAAAKAIS